MSQFQGMTQIEIKSIVDDLDKYGNTALLLCPIFDFPERRIARHEIARTLLSLGADPNIQNENSLFTPLHWACVNGATDVVQELLLSNAKYYIPDKYGFFPIDYAGLFKHTSCVEVLIDQLVKDVHNYRRNCMTATQWD